jgi:hypothetical protein
MVGGMMDLHAAILTATMLATPDAPVAAVAFELSPENTTPLPSDLVALAWRLDTTGDVTIAFTAGELVRQSAVVLRQLAVLPIIEEDERLIDDLVRRQSKSKTGRKRPIGRR